MQMLKEQSDAEWKAMEEELQSSDEEAADEKENMSWWDWTDPDIHFTLSTKYKNMYLDGQ